MELGIDPINAVLLFWGCYLIGALLARQRSNDEV